MEASGGIWSHLEASGSIWAVLAKRVEHLSAKMQESEEKKRKKQQFYDVFLKVTSPLTAYLQQLERRGQPPGFR